MITLKGAEVSAKIKEQVTEDLKKLGGTIPTLAIVRVGEKPDDMSYERGEEEAGELRLKGGVLCVPGGYHGSGF